MARKEVTLNVNFAEMTDEELYAFRDKLIEIREKMDDEWAKELASFAGEDFDQYSFWGERKMKKLAKKHAKRTCGLVYLQEVLSNEFRRRDKYKEEQMYAGKLKRTYESEEDFLERESIKTQSYKSKIE